MHSYKPAGWGDFSPFSPLGNTELCNVMSELGSLALIVPFKILIKRWKLPNSAWHPGMSGGPTLHYHTISFIQLLIWIFLSIPLSGQRSASIFPTSGCCCASPAETVSAAAVSSPPADQPSPANLRAKAPASPATPPCLRANQWVSSYGMFLSYTSHDKRSDLRVVDFVHMLSQARFSDTEEDCSSRTPVSRQFCGDVKQVCHASQRSKVRGHNMGEFERTAAHNPTDPAICLLSQVTVSIGAWLMSTYCCLP